MSSGERMRDEHRMAVKIAANIVGHIPAKGGPWRFTLLAESLHEAAQIFGADEAFDRTTDRE